MTVVGLRPVRDDDREWLLRWRNEPSVWAYGMTRRKVSVKEHRDWFKRLDRERAFIITELGEPVGHVRAEPEITIFVIPEARRRGVALSALKKFALRIDAMNAGTGTLRAQVHPLNVASVNLFVRAGFEYVGVAPSGCLAFGWRPVHAA